MEHRGWVEITNTYRFDGEYLWCRCIMPEPHTCPTCDGYGYLRWNGEYAGWSKVDQISHNVLHKDIPCPDCNV